METVLDWAVAQGYRIDNPAARSITKVLPKMPRTKQHHPALHYRDVPQALEKVKVSTADAVTKLAFEFLVLTAARSGGSGSLAGMKSTGTSGNGQCRLNG